MSVTLSDSEFKLFRQYIIEKCGIDIPEEKAYLIETRLSKLLADSGLSSFEELYDSIRSSNDYQISEKLIDSITTNETLWFRDKSPWSLLEDLYLPEFIKKLRSGEKQKIRIWSAAASTGQEAYSTAMCIDSWLFRNGIRDIDLGRFEILATDISQTVLEIAHHGRYDAISVMRGLDAAYKDKYFIKSGTSWEIDEKIRSAVRFQKFNLQNSFLLLGKFDVVFCRYVLIYFSDILKSEVTEKIASCMNKDAVLFIGASELYSSLEKSFKMIYTGKGTYYIRREDSNENANR